MVPVVFEILGNSHLDMFKGLPYYLIIHSSDSMS